MSKLIGQRAIASLLSLIVLMVLVFFLSRLTGDPAALFLLGLRCRAHDDTWSSFWAFT